MAAARPERLAPILRPRLSRSVPLGVRIKLEHLPRPAPATALVLVAVAFGLWVLGAETTPVMNLNDGSVHLAMVRWARHLIDVGKVPLDGWFPYFSTGTSLFHRYQSFPHLVVAYASLLTGVTTAYYWSLYLLLALWPISVYLGARMMGWNSWISGAAALVSPLLVSTPGYGFEHGSYTWRGLGVWSQLFGMWLLPIAWGVSWRVVSRGRGYALGALTLALTIACHFLTAYLALLTVGVWVIAKPVDLLRRAGRGAVLGVGAVLVASWVIVPILADTKWSAGGELTRGTFWEDSFGAAKVLGWLASGAIYDSGRVPVITALVAVGIVVCLIRSRWDDKSRALLGAWLLSLLLFIGRPTLGAVINLLPMNHSLLLHRYIMGVHMAGIILAGVGAIWIATEAVALTRRLLPRLSPVLPAAAAAVLGVAFLWPAWTQVAAYDNQGAMLIAGQQLQEAAAMPDVQALLDEAGALGPGRVYAGNHFSASGRQYRIGYVPVYAVLANQDVDAIGFYGRTPSLMEDIETHFDETRADQYDLFGIRYLILPQGTNPAVAATLVDQRGGNALWTVPTSGYLGVVDLVGPAIFADQANYMSQAEAFLRSSLPAHHQYQAIAFADARAPLPPVTAGQGSPGSVLLEADQPRDGSFFGQVRLTRPATVLLKASWDPRWKATVDGVAVPTVLMAPAYVGVPVGAGTHLVDFVYEPISYYGALLALAGVTLLGLALIPRMATRLIARASLWIRSLRIRPIHLLRP